MQRVLRTINCLLAIAFLIFFLSTPVSYAWTKDSIYSGWDGSMTWPTSNPLGRPTGDQYI